MVKHVLLLLSLPQNCGDSDMLIVAEDVKTNILLKETEKETVLS